jgi:transcriptional regulator with XRE-family HTH domain
MATTLAPVADREVLRCDHCSLVQFRTTSSICRRCKKPLEVELPVAAAPGPVLVTETPEDHSGPQVARAVRELRHRRNLSQRQLAGRMQVPRTYISKIENARAVPTLSSLQRLATALEVHLTELLADRRDIAHDVLSDPFIAEIAPLLLKIDPLQRALFLNQVREIAAGRRRSA